MSDQPIRNKKNTYATRNLCPCDECTIWWDDASHRSNNAMARAERFFNDGSLREFWSEIHCAK